MKQGEGTFAAHKGGARSPHNWRCKISSQKEIQDLLTKEMFEVDDWTSFCLREMNFMFACSFLASNLVVGHGKQQWAAACRGLR